MENFFHAQHLFIYIYIKNKHPEAIHSWISFNYFITLYKLYAVKFRSSFENENKDILLLSYSTCCCLWVWHDKNFSSLLFLSRISHSSNSIPTNSCLCLLSDQRSVLQFFSHKVWLILPKIMMSKNLLYCLFFKSCYVVHKIISLFLFITESVRLINQNGLRNKLIIFFQLKNYDKHELFWNTDTLSGNNKTLHVSFVE